METDKHKERMKSAKLVHGFVAIAAFFSGLVTLIFSETKTEAIPDFLLALYALGACYYYASKN